VFYVTETAFGNTESNKVVCTLSVVPKISLALTVDNICSGNFNVVASGGSGTYNYEWQKKTGTTWTTIGGNTSQVSYVYTPASSGGFDMEYSVEVTDPLAGCVNKVVRAQPPCCASGMMSGAIVITPWNKSAFASYVSSVNNVVTPSASALINYANTYNPSIISGGNKISTTQNIIFDNDFQVNTDIKFDGCTNMRFVNMHSGAFQTKIVVQGSKNLSILGSDLRSACNTMWGGIRSPQAGATVTVKNSYLKNMSIDGILMVAGTTLTCADNTFEDNRTCITLNNTPTGYEGQITGNTFKSTATNLYVPDQSTIAETGIKLNKVESAFIGDQTGLLTNGRNTFSKLRTGIYINNW
jgi:hypothetical protein